MEFGGGWGGGVLVEYKYECYACMEVVCLLCVCIRACNKQSVHAWWSLGGLEHFGDVLLRQRRLPPALSLGVFLLPPLEVLEGEEHREFVDWGFISGKGIKKKNN